MVRLDYLKSLTALLYREEPIAAIPSVPVSDLEARATYTSAAWADLDRFGQPRFGPSNRNSEEVPPWVFPAGHFTLPRSPLASTHLSMVFALNGGFVVKYHGFCESFDEPVDSVLRESYFTELVNELSPGLVPKIPYFSAAVPASQLRTPKLPSHTDVKCDDPSVDRMVRFMVMERVGWDLQDLVDARKKVRFFDAIRLGIEVFRNIEKLHAMNVQHGDIHAGNVAFREIGLDLASVAIHELPLVLIDLGRAKLGSEEDVQVDSELVYCSGYYSPWESVNLTPSYRDDVFRAMLVLAVMIHGTNHRDVQEMICGPNGEPERITQYMRLKEEENFFDWVAILPVGRTASIKYTFSLTEVLATVGVVESSSVDSIREILGTLLSQIRAMSFHAKADYVAIVHQLERILGFEPIVVL